jgi:hypothetical protein
LTPPPPPPASESKWWKSAPVAAVTSLVSTVPSDPTIYPPTNGPAQDVEGMLGEADWLNALVGKAATASTAPARAMQQHCRAIPQRIPTLRIRRYYWLNTLQACGEVNE